MSKSLDKVVGDIEKLYGKGSVVNFEEGVSDIEFVSSGSIALDLALGGGYPKGRIIESYGAESSGKCLTKDAYILTNNGYKTVEQIFNSQGLKTFCVHKNIEKKYPLINMYGDVEDTTHFTFNGKKKVYKVKTKSGFIHKGTHKHPLLCISENGNLIWKWMGELKKGDYLVSRNINDRFGSTHEDKDFSYLIGLIIADGSMQDIRIGITNDDDGIKSFIENLAPQLLGVEYNKYSNNENGSFDYHFNSKEKVEQFYKLTNLSPAKSKHKILSEYIMSFDKDTMSSFLCGYLDSEAYFYKSGMEVSSASYDLLYQIKLILSQYSISSTISSKNVKAYPDNDYWQIHISGQDYLKFINNIGLLYSKSNKQKDKMLEYLLESDERSTLSNIPNILPQIKDLYQNSERNAKIGKIILDLDLKKINCSKSKLKEILSSCDGYILNRYIFCNLRDLLNYKFDPIEQIEELEPQPTFDFSMERTHSFIADGCINHNTTIAIHALVQVQKEGQMGVYFDYENALDPVYMESLGVDFSKDKLLIVYPNTTEQGFEMMRKFVGVDEVGIIVVDSVAAMVPQAELEGDFGDSKMGLQARAMSQALRMLVSDIKKSDTIAYFINQTRDKLNVMFGNPETTTGGNALKFYATQRIRLAKSTVTKDKEGEAISTLTKITIDKNKVAPPKKKAQINIRYGIGFDLIQEIIDFGVELGIIKKSGSWFSYGDTKLGQGAESVRALLEDNPELFEELDRKVRIELGLIEE